MYIVLFLVGILGGVISGLLGVGGGVIFIAILPNFLFLNSSDCANEQVQFVVVNSIFCTFLASFSGSLVRVIKNDFRYKEVFIISIFSSITILFVKEFILTAGWYSVEMFTWFVVLLLIYMVAKMFFSKEKVTDLPIKPNYMVGVIGIVGGFVSGLSGLGGGVAMVPLIKNYLKVDVKSAKNISLGVIVFSSLSLTISNLIDEPSCRLSHDKYQIGYIVLPLALLISLGVIVGAPLGMLISEKLNSKWIKWIFSLFLLLVCVKKLLDLYY